MVYLSGCDRVDLAAVADVAPVGLMAQPGNGTAAAVGKYRWWAADNGCFAQGESFDAQHWIAWLSRLEHRERCMFATAPDVVANMAATIARSRPWLAEIRRQGLPAGLVAQDGGRPEMLPWGEFDALFLGGTTAWKLSSAAHELTAEARRRGLPVHMGRVNSLRRLLAAELMGCTSADGTFLAFRARRRGQERTAGRGVPEVLEWLGRVEAEPFLPLGVGA